MVLEEDVVTGAGGGVVDEVEVGSEVVEVVEDDVDVEIEVLVEVDTVVELELSPREELVDSGGSWRTPRPFSRC